MLHKPLQTAGRCLPLYAAEVVLLWSTASLRSPCLFTSTLPAKNQWKKNQPPDLLKCITNRGRNFWGVGMGRATVVKGYQERDKGMIPISVDVAANNWRNSLSIHTIRQYLNWNQCVKLPVAICVSNVFLTFLDSLVSFQAKGLCKGFQSNSPIPLLLTWLWLFVE